MALVDVTMLKRKFDSFKSVMEEQVKPVDVSSFVDDRFIQFKPGKTYKFRLLYTQSEHREGPFIEKYIHASRGENKKYVSAVCPKTDLKAYLQKCPVCANNKKLWDSGSETDRQLYSTHKPKFHGFALVYVVDDPGQRENNGHVKMIHYSVLAKRVFDWEIFGVVKDTGKKDSDNNENSEGETTEDVGDEIGYDVFKLEQGFDLIVKVESVPNEKWYKYTFKFARRATDVTMDTAEMDQEIEDIDFDSLICHYSDEEIQTYFNTHVLSQMETEDEPEHNDALGQIPPKQTTKATQQKPVTDLDAALEEGADLMFKPATPAVEDVEDVEDVEEDELAKLLADM